MSEDTPVNEVVEPKGTLIKATDPTTKAEAEFYFDFGTAENLITAFGAEVVLQGFIASQKIVAQSRMRELLKAGKTSEEVAAYMTENWRPGVAAKDPVAAFVAKLTGMSEDERKKAIEALMKTLG